MHDQNNSRPGRGVIPQKSRGGKSQGAALVIVLSFLVIITGLTIAFLSNVTDHAAETNASVAGVQARNLADAAIQLTIAQIRDGTLGYERDQLSGGINPQAPACWASQPGAIRTYDLNASNIATYKLYSARVMVDRSGSSPTNDLPPKDWVQRPSAFCDLNAPVVINGVTNYPILDPSLSALSNGIPIVDGFSIDSNTATTLLESSNKAAMPVSWLYMLKDGTLIVPDPGSDKTASFSTSPQKPTEANPIVGRIAFWADDETCKLNLNTASEGSFWGQPFFTTSQDVAWALMPPAPKEFNRFPGHPASTSLSPVLWSFYNLTNPAVFMTALPQIPRGSANYDAGNGAMTPTPPNTNYLASVFTNIAPRYAWGGSLAGSVSVLTSNAPSAIRTNTPVMTMGKNRFYASVDEFFFAATNPISQESRVTNGMDFTPRDIAGLRFFLTTDSRAPEVNPLNLPKLCLWPVPDSNRSSVANPNAAPAGKNRTLNDSMIAYCSTIGTNAFYFTRYDATSARNDIQISGAVPGRNQVLYNYFRNQLDKKIPGFQGSFVADNKWRPIQADQMATLMFDYIRSCINLDDASGATNRTLASDSFRFAYTAPPGIVSGNTTVMTNGVGQVVPIEITNPSGNRTRGIGRFLTMKGAAVWFIARAADQPPLLVDSVRRPQLFTSAGTSTTLSPTTIQTTMASYATAAAPTGTAPSLMNYARVNPLHPWTCPPAAGNAPAAGTFAVNANYTPNSIVSASGDILLPQLRVNSGSTPLPVYACNGADPTTMAEAAARLYPVFNLFQANTAGLPPTRAYPSLDGNNGLYTTVDGTVKTIQVGTTFFKYFQASNRTLTGVRSGNAYSYTTFAPTANPAVVSTHPGLPYLTVQNPITGAFDLPNPTYKDDPLLPHQTRMEMQFVPDLVSVAPGQIGLFPKMTIDVQGLNSFSAGGNALNFNSPQRFSFFNMGSSSPATNLALPPLYDFGLQFLMNADGGTNNLCTVAPFPVISTNATSIFNFSGGTVTCNLAGPDGATSQSVVINFPTANFPIPKLISYYNPGYTVKFNYPPAVNSDLVTNSMLTFRQNDSKLGNGNFSRLRGLGTPSSTSINGMQSTYFPDECGSVIKSGDPTYPYATNGLDKIPSDTIRAVDLIYGDARMIAPLGSVPASFFSTNAQYANASIITINGWKTQLRGAHSLRSGSLPLNGGQYRGSLISTNLATPGNSYFYPPMRRDPFDSGSDTSMVSLTNNIVSSSPAMIFSNYFGRMGMLLIGRGNRGPGLNATSSGFWIDGHCALPYAGNDCLMTDANFLRVWTNGGDYDNGIGFTPDGPFINKVDEAPTGFSTTVGSPQLVYSVNPYFTTATPQASTNGFSPNRMVPSSSVFGSLPVGFSSLALPSTSTNILTNSWLTMLFAANPNALSGNLRDARAARAGYNEAGGGITNAILPDHLMLDFFRMPVVEPYPISDPLSTAGKVNMNYQIAPFSYIHRDSAMRGVLKSTMITAVDEQWGFDYKLRTTASYGAANEFSFNDASRRTNSSGVPNALTFNAFGDASGNMYFHYPIHVTNTLQQFERRFTNAPGGDLFRSPSEICALWLYPAQQPTAANPLVVTNSLVAYDPNNVNIKNWWYSTPGITRKGLTGDNIRERPYSYLYPRLTTKSNTYQVHFWAQSIKQTKAAHPRKYDSMIDPAKGGITDKVTGEIRGSAILERYVDSSDPTLPDYAQYVTSGNQPVAKALNDQYKFRVFSFKQFIP